MPRFALALTLWTLFACTAAAQDASGQARGVSGKAAVGYLSTSGNTESRNTNAALSILYQLLDWGHDFEASAVSASSSDETTAEAYLLEYEARRAYGEHHYLFTALDWKRDRFSGYPQQVSETVGYGRRLIDHASHMLDGGLGIGARQSELQDGTEEGDAIVRGSMDYLWAMTDTTEFEQQFIVETGSTNTMLESRSALRARIIGDISLVLSFRFKQNSAVPAGAANADRFSSISLEYAF